jgi:DNA-binding winged helix-turn-helix (wHTH) protein
MRILLRLVEDCGKTVSRAELMDAAWPSDGNVTDESLTKAMSILRGSVRHCGLAKDAIQTVPKIGYRLVVPARDTFAEVSPAEEALVHIERHPGLPAAHNRMVKKNIVPYQLAMAVLLVITGAMTTFAFVRPEPEVSLRIRRHHLPAAEDSLRHGMLAPVDTVVTGSDALGYMASVEGGTVRRIARPADPSD